MGVLTVSAGVVTPARPSKQLFEKGPQPPLDLDGRPKNSPAPTVGRIGGFPPSPSVRCLVPFHVPPVPLNVQPPDFPGSLPSGKHGPAVRPSVRWPGDNPHPAPFDRVPILPNFPFGILDHPRQIFVCSPCHANVLSPATMRDQQLKLNRTGPANLADHLRQPALRRPQQNPRRASVRHRCNSQHKQTSGPIVPYSPVPGRFVRPLTFSLALNAATPPGKSQPPAAPSHISSGLPCSMEGSLPPAGEPTPAGIPARRNN